jgi:hypothetical protein
MKSVKHFYYPYYYIENFNGSIISIFFLDNTFHFEDEDDIFSKRLQFKSLKKGKKVIEESNNLELLDKIKKIDNKLFIDNFFVEFFLEKC